MTQEFPYVVEVEGKKAFCMCGKSENMPFCDGSHKGSEVGPCVETFEQARTVAICGCGRSGKRPFCDGSHNRG